MSTVFVWPIAWSGFVSNPCAMREAPSTLVSGIAVRPSQLAGNREATVVSPSVEGGTAVHWRQESVLAVGHRAQNFLDKHADVLEPLAAGTRRNELDAAVTGLEKAAKAQSLAQTERTGLTKEKNRLRRNLFDLHLRPIAHMARRKLSDTKDIYTMRVPNKRIDDTRLVVKAHAMADEAARYRQVFLGQQMPANFVKECHAAAKEFLGVVMDRDLRVARLVEATAAVAWYTDLVRDAMRTLNAQVVSKLHKNRAFDLWGAWNTARRYGKKPGPKRPRARRSAAKKSDS